MSAKSVVGEVYWRIYWLVTSLRGDCMSSRPLTGENSDAIEVSVSASTVTSSDTEASFNESEVSTVFPAATMMARCKVAKPAAETWTEYGPGGNPDIAN